MSDPIQDDVQAQVAALAALLRATFDVHAYPTLTDGPTFDARVLELERAIGRLTTLFNDFLVHSWSGEIAGTLDEIAARRKSGR
jgi:hypothetical protein